MGKALMVLGTSSGAGKSLLATALCRIFSNLSYDVVPFKSQNMSLNSAPSIEGGEISRVQYLQAIACRKKPSVKFNPILLKPEDNMRSQVVFMGNPSEEFRPGTTCCPRRRSFSGRRWPFSTS